MLEKHADWWRNSCLPIRILNRDNIHEILRGGRDWTRVPGSPEDAGVYKRTDEGNAAFRFIEKL